MTTAALAITSGLGALSAKDVGDHRCKCGLVDNRSCRSRRWRISSISISSIWVV
jgi:hypothetical protein